MKAPTQGIPFTFIITLLALGLALGTIQTQAQNRKKAAAPPPTFADVAYDEHERTKLDFWQAEGEGPRPVQVFIHGGGWIQGDKKNCDKHEALYKEFSAYYHLTPDDPPMLLGYNADLTVPAKSVGHGIHHGMFGMKLQEKSKEVGHDKVYLQIRGHGEPTPYSNTDDFITRILLGEKSP